MSEQCPDRRRPKGLRRIRRGGIAKGALDETHPCALSRRHRRSRCRPSACSRGCDGVKKRGYRRSSVGARPRRPAETHDIVMAIYYGLQPRRPAETRSSHSYGYIVMARSRGPAETRYIVMAICYGPASRTCRDSFVPTTTMLSRGRCRLFWPERGFSQLWPM